VHVISLNFDDVAIGGLLMVLAARIDRLPREVIRRAERCTIRSPGSRADTL
jgi:hypothetical protein